LLRSMTGFGRGEHTGKLKQVTVEIKAVNNRFGEVQIKIPYQYLSLEENIRRYVLSQVSRGRIDVYIKLKDTSQRPRELQVDKDLAVTYYKTLEELAAITGIPCEVNVQQIAQFPEVLTMCEKDEELDVIWQDIQPALQTAVSEMLEMREKEGRKLKEDLLARLQTLQQFRDKIFEKSPRVVQNYREKLNARLQELMIEDQIDEERLALEVALFADKCNIDEELVRLNSHFLQFAQNLEEDIAVGRKLDFLLQEINREVNTIGSKANDLEITQAVVELKSELEKIREQVQNIE
jgi:uncharacterized protein (TIGR00255 family)